MAIGNRIKELRLKKGWSQRQLAEAADVRVQTICNAERNIRDMKVASIVCIAKGLGTTVADLISAEETSFPVVLDKDAVMPTRAHISDAGYDLFAPIGYYLPANSSCVIDTGVHIAIPKGYAGVIISKSGLNMKSGIISDGLIDSGYTGSIQVKLYNLSDKNYMVAPGDKISQIMFLPIAEPTLSLVDALEDTERGNAGFGSTGR